MGKNKSRLGQTVDCGPTCPAAARLLSSPHVISLRHMNPNFWGPSSSQDTFWIFFLGLKDNSLSSLLFFGIFFSLKIKEYLNWGNPPLMSKYSSRTRHEDIAPHQTAREPPANRGREF